jgi:ribosomal protein S18 acetylase RimI-like enzyme
VIRKLRTEDEEICDAIVADLPGWFGMEEGRNDCARAVRTQDGLVALQDGEVLGFLTWVKPRPRSAEITWMAVKAGRHREGHGRRLIQTLVDSLAAQGVRLLAVKTLSEEDPDPGYAKTRAFYEAMGFVPTMGLSIWGPENPALLLIRPI